MLVQVLFLLLIDWQKMVNCNSKITISVIMACYREPSDIVRAAIDSVLSQEGVYVELILILDDPENASLHSLLLQYSEADPRVKLLINAENIGLAQSLNKGISVARAEFIARMDADDICEPRRLQIQHACLMRESLDLIGGQLRVIDDDGQGMYDVRRVPTSASKVTNALKWNNVVPHPTWFGKASVFSEGYRSIACCEDYDFLLRASLRGVRIGNCADVVLKYRMSKSSISRDNLYRQYLYQVFITRNYRRGKVAEISDADKYVNRKWNIGKDRRYSLANARFNCILDLLDKRRYAAAPLEFFRLVFTSFAYDLKVLRLLVASL